jgi:nicotinamidase-related amidase
MHGARDETGEANGRLHIPPHSALLLVDLQRGFVSAATGDLPSRVAAVLDEHEHRFELVVASRFVNDETSPVRRLLGYEGMADESEIALCDGIERAMVRVQDKTTYALGERLGRLLATHRTRTLFLAGMDTHACVLHEAMDAFDRCIRPIVLHDLCASGDGPDAHRAALLVLRQSIGVQNVLGLDGVPLLS